MRAAIQLLLTCLLVLIFYLNLSAQCPPVGFPEPANNCINAPILCDSLDGYCTTINNSNTAQIFPGCNWPFQLNNDEWFAFIANSTTIEIEVVPSNCTNNGNNQGLQAGIYSNCSGSNSSVMDVQCSCTTNTFTLYSDQYVVGQVYYFVVDGCAGDVCDFDVNVLIGSTVGNPPSPPGAINGPTTVCENDVSNYTVNPVTGATQYNWTLTPSIGFVDTSGTETAAITWNGGPGTAQLCVDVENLCFSNATNSCISIIVNPEAETLLAESVCDGDCFTVGTSTYCTSGSYSDNLLTSEGCDSIVKLDLIVIDVTSQITGDNLLTCNNGGIITLDGSGSTPSGITYNWTTSDGNIVGSNTGSTIDIDMGGTYELEVSYTQNGTTCTDNASFTVTENNTPPTIDISPPDNLDCNFTTTTIDASGSSNGNQYNWSGPSIVSGQGTPTITVDGPGTYTVTLTNSQNGCTAEDMVTVSEDITPPNIVILPPEQLNCDVTTVTIDATGSDTGPNFTYNWSGGSIISGGNTLMPTVDGPGNYTLTITNSDNGCTAEESVQVSQDITPPPASVTTPGQLDCNNATLVIDGSGSGNGNSTFVWTTSGGGNIVSGGNTLMPTIDQPGTYTIEVTDGNNGCTNTASVTIGQDTNPPVVDAGPPQLIDCNSSSVNINGSVSGGNSFTINWSTPNGNIVSGGNTMNPTVDEPGTYTVVVTNDENGCTAEDSVTVTEDLNEPTAVIAPPEEVTCAIPNITLDGTGSSTGPPHTFNWSGPGIVSGGNTLTPTINAGGSYTLNVVNTQNGCTAEATINVPENTTPPPATIAIPPQLDCNNSAVTLDGTGSGNSNSTFNWSGPGIISGGNTLMPTVNASGTYTINVTDNDNGCTSSATITVVEDFSPPNVNAGADEVLNCFNPNSVILNGNGSNSGPGYNINWTTNDGNIVFGANTLTPTVDEPGTYTLTIINTNNGCSDTDEVMVTEDLEQPIVMAFGGGEVTCFTPLINLSGTGSSSGPGFNISWSGPGLFSGQGTLTPTVNAGGTYTLTITNTNNGCSDEASVTIGENLATPDADIFPANQIDCNNPTVTVDASNSVLIGNNTTIDWTTINGNILSGNNSLTPTVNGAGTYTLTLINQDNGCLDEASITVLEDTTLPTANAGNDQIMDCVNVTPFLNGGGSSSGPGITYQWSTIDGNIVFGANTQTPSIDAGGTYTILVTNTNNGCTAEDQVTVTEDNTPPYIEIVDPPFLDCYAFNGEMPLDGSNSDYNPNYTIFWTTIGGSFVSGENTLIPTINAPGSYTLFIINPFNGCSNDMTVNVSGDVDPPIAVLSPAETLNCDNETLLLDASQSSSPGNFSFTWSTMDGNIVSGSNTLTPVIDQTGTYIFTITNSINGCTDEASVTIDENFNYPDAEAGDDQTLGCTQPNLTLDGTLSSTGPEFDYIWTDLNGNTVATGTQTPTVGTAGTYTLTVINTNNGCTAADFVIINQDTDLPVIEVGAVEDVTCTTPSITIDASNSDQGNDFQFEWITTDGSFESGQNSLSPIVNTGGTYTLTITNVLSNCSSSQNIIVTEDNLPPDLTIADADLLNCANSDSDLNASTNINVSDLDIFWTTQNGNITGNTNTLNTTADAPGEYVLTLINLVNGCEIAETIIVNEDLDVPLAIAGDDEILTCDIDFIQLNGTSSSSGNPYINVWINENGDTLAENTLSPNVEFPGTYILTIYNEISECQASDTLIIEQDLNAPNVEIEVADTLTCGNLEFVLDASNSDSGTDLQVSWQTTNGNILSGDSTLTPQIDAPGTYVLTIFNTTNNCETSQQVTVNQDTINPIAEIIFPDTLDCDDLSIILNAENSGSIFDYNITWQTPNGNIISDTDTLSVEVDMPGDYTLNLVNEFNGCTAAATVNVAQDIEDPVAEAGGDLTILCTVPSVTLDGSQSSIGSVFEYSWTDANGMVISNEQSPNVSIAGNYNLTVINTQNGCLAIDSMTILQDDNLPNIEIATLNPLTCADQNIVIDASNSDNGAGITTTWQTVDGNIISGSDNLTPNIDQIGTYTLTIFNTNNGCSTTENVLITEDLTPPNPQIGLPDTLTCSTESLILDASNSGDETNFQISWTTSNGTIVSGDQSLNPEINAPGTYTLNLINVSNGCSESLDIDVIQDIEIPTADAGVNDLLTCSITTLELSGMGSGNAPVIYSWETTDGELLSGFNTPNPTIGQPGNYTLTITNTFNGCTETDEVFIDQDIISPPILIATPDLISCIDTIVNIDASGSISGIDYQIQWTTTDGIILSGDQTLTPSVGEVGTYNLTILNTQNGCESNQPIAVQEDISILTATIETPQLLTCETLDINLISEGIGGNDLVYEWTTLDGNILSGNNTEMPNINEPGTYSVLITDSNNGCTAESQILVDQDILSPNADAGADDSVSCVDPEATLDGALSSVGTNIVYLWTTIDGNILSGDNTLNPIVDEGGIYSLLVTNIDNGCTATSTTEVEELSTLPQVSINFPDTLTCNVLSVELNSTVTGVDLSLFNIQWSTSDGNILTGANTLYPIVDANGTYILSIVNPQSADCTVTEQIVVPEDTDSPQPQIEATSILTCTFLTLDLDATNSTSSENFNIQWTTSNGNILTGANTLNPQIDDPGTYTLTLINNENGCSASQNVDIEEDVTPPIADASVEGELNCEEQQLNLDGLGSSQGPQFSYLWSTQNGIITSGQTTLQPVITGPGTYTLDVMNEDNGCDGSDDVNVTQDIQDPIASAGNPAEINCETGEAYLIGSVTSTSTNIDFSWVSTNGTIISGQNTETPIVNGLGDYTLIVTNLDNGCTDESTVPVIENLPLGELESREPPCIDELGEITITNVMDGTPPYEYSFDNGATFSANNIGQNLTPGTYSIIVKDSKGCEFFEQIFIPAGLDPVLIMETEVQLQLGETYQVNVDLNFDESEISSIQWLPSEGLSCDNCLNPVISPTSNTAYQVIIRTQEECETTGNVTILVDKDARVYIPNAFSPNSDGINDVFMIYAADNNVSKIKSFLGFNRWGETVFEFRDFDPNDPKFGWNGKFRGEKMNAQVLVWFAEIEFIDGSVELFKGDVTLIR